MAKELVLQRLPFSPRETYPSWVIKESRENDPDLCRGEIYAAVPPNSLEGETEAGATKLLLGTVKVRWWSED